MLPLLRDPAPAQDARSGLVLSAEVALRHLAAQGFVLFHPTLAERLDSFKAAIFLGHALYWTRHLAHHQPRRNGWFFMTARQWQDATGLTTREQTAVRALLIKRGILLQSIAGRPARLHYKVNLPELAQTIGLIASESGTIGWEAFAPWLRTCVSFYRPLADATGSIAAGLYLSYLLQSQRAIALNPMSIDPEGFFRAPQDDIRIALCLGPKVQRNARLRLKQAGLIEERAALVRVRLDRVMARLSGAEPSPAHRPVPALAQSALADAGAGRAAGNGSVVSAWPSGQEAAAELATGSRPLFDLQGWLEQSPDGPATLQSVQRMFASAVAQATPSVADSRQDGPAAVPEGPCQPFALLSNQTCRFVEPIYQYKTIKQRLPRAREAVDNSAPDETAGRRRRASRTSHPHPVPAQPDAQAVLSSSEVATLVLPERLDKAWHEAVLRTVVQAPEAVRQALLDELGGQLGIEGKTIHNPAGWLHALVRRHAKGTLDLAMAEKVAADRRQRERSLRAVEQASKKLPEPAAAQAVTEAQAEPSEVARAARAQLRALRAGFAAKGGRND